MTVDWTDRSPQERTVLVGNLESASQVLAACPLDDIIVYFRTARLHRAEDRMFHIFESLLAKDEMHLEMLDVCMDEHPPLAYCVLKKFLQDGGEAVSPSSRARLAISVARGIIRSANELGMAALAGLERLASYIAELNLSTYLDLVWLASLIIRASQVVQEVLLVLHDSRVAGQESTPPAERHAHTNSLAIAFDRAEEAADSCPCDEHGRPKRQREVPISTKLCLVPPPKDSDETEPEIPDQSQIPTRVMAHVRVDLKVPIRIHSHVRLRVASSPEHSTLPAAIVDAVAVRASRGEICLDVLHPLPPEWSTIDWYLYPAGSIVTSRAMMDAVQRLAVDGLECCRFRDIITGQEDITQPPPGNDADEDSTEGVAFTSTLNASQQHAVLSTRLGSMSLIWGPPGVCPELRDFLFLILSDDRDRQDYCCGPDYPPFPEARSRRKSPHDGIYT